MSRKTVLIVDDEKDIRDLLKLSLNKLGLDSLTAADISEATQLVLSDKTLDFCLTDVRLPDGSGLEIVQLFKEERPDTPIAVMTAFDSTDIAVDAMRAGAFDFLSKPIMAEVLRAKATVFLELWRRSEEIASQAQLLREHERREHSDQLERARKSWERRTLQQQMIEQQQAADKLARKAEELARTVAEKERAEQGGLHERAAGLCLQVGAGGAHAYQPRLRIHPLE